MLTRQENAKTNTGIWILSFSLTKVTGYSWRNQENRPQCLHIYRSLLLPGREALNSARKHVDGQPQTFNSVPMACAEKAALSSYYRCGQTFIPRQNLMCHSANFVPQWRGMLPDSPDLFLGRLFWNPAILRAGVWRTHLSSTCLVAGKGLNNFLCLV